MDLAEMMSLFYQPFTSLRLPPPSTFASQTILITGANVGLGFAAAQHFVTLGASKVILGVRTISKGVEAKSVIESQTHRLGVVEVWEVDLESFASVQAFAARAKALDRLDVAVMNAGLGSGVWNLSPDGWERQLQVNVLSTAMLGLLLLPLLVRTGKKFGVKGEVKKPHLVVLSSNLHKAAELREQHADNVLKALNEKKYWEESRKNNLLERYAVTKLFDVYLTMELAEMVPMIGGEPAVIVNCLSPGFCKSQLMKREPGAPLILKVLEFLTARTVQEGSKTIVNAAVEGSETHGKYLDTQKIARPGNMVTSEEGVQVRKKVWAEILDVLTAAAPEIGNMS